MGSKKIQKGKVSKGACIRNTKEEHDFLYWEIHYVDPGEIIRIKTPYTYSRKKYIPYDETESNYDTRKGETSEFLIKRMLRIKTK